LTQQENAESVKNGRNDQTREGIEPSQELHQHKKRYQDDRERYQQRRENQQEDHIASRKLQPCQGIGRHRVKQQRHNRYRDGYNKAIEHVSQEGNLGEDVNEVHKRWSLGDKCSPIDLVGSFERTGKHPQKRKNRKKAKNDGQDKQY